MFKIQLKAPIFMAFFALGFSTNPVTVNWAIAENKTAELARENFLQADFDHNGVLQYAEFATFIDLSASDGLGNASLISKRGLYGRAFSRVDANSDGFVSQHELTTIMK